MLAYIPQGMALVPLLSKVFLLAAILIGLRISTRNDTESVAPWFFAAVAWLFIADIAFFVAPLPAFDLVARSLFPLAPAIPYLWRHRRSSVIIIAAAGLASAAASAVLSGLSLIPSAVLYIFPLASALIAIVYLWGHYGRNDEPFLHASAFLALSLSYLFAPLAAFIVSCDSIIYQAAVLPLSYLAFLISGLEYARSIEFRLIEERDHLSDTIDSLYGFVLKANESVRGEMELDKLLAYVAQTLCVESKSDGALVLMIDDFDDVVVARSSHGSFPPIIEVPPEIKIDSPEYETWLLSLRIPLGEGLIGETAQSGKPSFIPVAADDHRLIVNRKSPLGGIISVPFVINDRIIGVGLIARKADSPVYKDADFDKASLLGDFASLVINNAFSFQEVTERTDIDTAASIAADIQKTLLPKRLIDLPQAGFGCFSEAARGVYSDYYDVIPARRNKIFLVMSDVAGKGVQASMVMVMIRAILQLVTNTDQDAATILNWVNRGITGKIEIDHFATLQIVIFDPNTGICEYANAGHKPPLIWKGEAGLVDAIDLRNDPIGVDRKTEFASQRFKLESGDILVLYTDGLIETINQAGRQYGIKSLTNQLHKYHELSPKDIAAKIGADVHNFAGHIRQHDDQTLLVMKTK